MKKIWSLLLIVFALCGCVGTPTQANKKFSNVQQENFDNMLARNKDKSYRLGNKIWELYALVPNETLAGKLP